VAISIRERFGHGAAGSVDSRAISIHFLEDDLASFHDQATAFAQRVASPFALCFTSAPDGPRYCLRAIVCGRRPISFRWARDLA